VKLTIDLDQQGLIAVHILTSSLEEQERAQRFFHLIRPVLEQLGEEAHKAGREIESGEDKAA
jgi:hypothetical protein